MEAKTIKISMNNYEWLSRFAAVLQSKKGRPVSFDEALTELKTDKSGKKSILDLAGSWKLSEEQTNKILKDIYKERNIKSRRL